MPASRNCAEKLLEVIPQIMDCLRCEFRLAAGGGQLTIPQFRVLFRLAKQPATHKEVAECLGVTLPTLSRMVEVLVQKRLVKPEPIAGDRRKTNLRLTPLGQTRHQACRAKVRERLEAKLGATLDPAALAALAGGLEVLGTLFPVKAPKRGKSS